MGDGARRGQEVGLISNFHATMLHLPSLRGEH